MATTWRGGLPDPHDHGVPAPCTHRNGACAPTPCETAPVRRHPGTQGSAARNLDAIDGNLYSRTAQ